MSRLDQKISYLIISSFTDLKHGPATVSYRINEIPTVGKHIEISSVRVPQKHRGKGWAKQAVTKVLDIADKHQVPVRLVASPLDKKTKTAKLVKFYRDLGFNTTGEKANVLGDPWMERKPRLVNM